jgi:dolichol-phosphate mannosyltransferase
LTLFFATSMGVRFDWAQTAAVIGAMSWNFFLNNLITYRDLRLRGWALIPGLASFYAICAVGAVANIGVAGLVFDTRGTWWLAGLAGAAIGAVWNFAVSGYLTWRRRTATCRRRATAPMLSARVQPYLSDTSEGDVARVRVVRVQGAPRS